MKSPNELTIGYKRFPKAVEIIESHAEPIEKLTVRSSDGDSFPPQILDALCSNSRLAGLQRLEIEELDINRDTLVALLNAPQLRNLRRLAFHDSDWQSHLGVEFTKVLASSIVPRELETLSLSAINFGHEGARILAGADFKNLRRLEIYDCNIGDDGVGEIVSSPLWNQLSVLHLGETLSRTGIERLVAAGRPAQLQRLYVSEFWDVPEVQELLKGAFGDAYADPLRYDRWEGEGAV